MDWRDESSPRKAEGIAMSVELFVSGFGKNLDYEELWVLVEETGVEVLDADVWCDGRTGESKGFGFVTLNSESDARQAIFGLRNTYICGHKIKVAKSQRN
jgi:RNA recognition motif-containing protein